jgi:transketolase
MTNLEKVNRLIFDISYKYKLSHIGSCLTTAVILNDLFEKKDKYDKIILSAGHSGLALYACLEVYEGKDAEALFLKHGVHPNRDIENNIEISAGSLGHGLGIAIGLAIANKENTYHCIISDGEAAEGSIWEALNIIYDKSPILGNLRIYLNCNGWGAYRMINLGALVHTVEQHLGDRALEIFTPINTTTVLDKYPFLIGQDAHYHVMTKDEYETTIC